MKKIIALLGLTVLVASCQESLQEKAAKACREYTETKCPTPFVNNTRTDSLIFEANSNTFHYYYTLSGQADNEQAIKTQQKQLRNILLTALKAETSSKLYKEASFNFQYTYHSHSKPTLVLLDETFTSKDYQ